MASQYIKYPNFGAGSMAIGNSVAGGTYKSVLFVDAAGSLAQENADFFYDPTTNALTITGVFSASNVSGTNTGDVTIGTANGLSILGQVLSLALSSTSTTGALSSTDWNTFNNKQDTLSGTDQQVVYFSGITPVGASNLIFDNSSIFLGIGQTTPKAILHVGSSTTSGTVGAGGIILGVPDATAGIGAGSIIFNGRSFGGNTASGTNASAFGNLNVSSGNRSLTQGFTNTASGSSAVAINALNLASGAFSLAAGEGTIAQAYGSAAFGFYNVAQGTTFPRTAGDQIFIIGNGVDASTRATAFYIDSDADAVLTGTFTASNFSGSSSGTNTGDVTVGTANGLSILGQVLSLALSSTSTTGALSSTDWNTFNNKQPAGSYITALTGDVTATGPGSVAATIAANAVSNSKLAQMPTLTLKGNNTGSPADPLDLTVSQVNTMLGTVTTASSPLSISLGNISFSDQTANTVLSGPTGGGPTAPTFRSLVAADIPAISLTAGVSGILPIANGGTNSSAALNNNRIIISSSGAIVEQAAITINRALKSDSSGLPVASTATAASLDALSGSNSGDVTLSAVGSSPNANAASLSGQVLNLEPASISFPGVVTTGSQSLAGAKTFTTSVSSPSHILTGATSGALTLSVPAVVTSYSLIFPAAQGSSSQTLINDGAGNLSWGLPAASLETAYVKDVKSSGTDGGTFTSGSWQTRDLNTLENSQSWISLGTNQFDLDSGTYEIEALAPVFGVNQHKIKLYDVTNTTDIIIGSSEFGGTVAQTSSSLKGTFTVSGTTTFEIQHQCVTTSTVNGFGEASSFSVDEIYTQVKITLVG